MARKAQGWLCALCLLCSLSVHAASPVWAIRGEHNTVYLAGSIHLLKSQEAALPAAFERAYARAGAVVMELDLGQVTPEDAATWMASHGKAAPGTLKRVLEAASYQRVLATATRLGLPAAALEQEAPWLLSLQLLALEYRNAGFDPQSGVEEQIERRAVSDGKPTRGLETLEEQLGVFDALSLPDQARFLKLTLQGLADVAEETQSVVVAWRTGDARRLAALLGEEYRSFPELYRALVTQRNQHWLPQIEQLLAEPHDVLVVVGALHLVGKGGLLELLRRDGHPAVSLD